MFMISFYHGGGATPAPLPPPQSPTSSNFAWNIANYHTLHLFLQNIKTLRSNEFNQVESKYGTFRWVTTVTIYHRSAFLGRKQFYSNKSNKTNGKLMRIPLKVTSTNQLLNYSRSPWQTYQIACYTAINSPDNRFIFHYSRKLSQ